MKTQVPRSSTSTFATFSSNWIAFVLVGGFFMRDYKIPIELVRETGKKQRRPNGKQKSPQLNLTI